MKSKKKTSWKVWAALLAILAVIGIGGSSSKSKEEPSRAVATAEPTATPEPTETPVPTATPYRIHGWPAETTVYISNSGKIHFRSDCSGMKNYTEMSLEEADAAGYEYCDKCR